MDDENEDIRDQDYTAEVEELRARLALAGEDLQEANQRAINILESIDDAFIAYDREWRYIYINNVAAKEILEVNGRTSDDLIGKIIWEEFPDLVGTTLYEEYHRAIAEQSTVRFETNYGVAGGRWYHISAYPSQDGLSVYFEDITERKRVEEELVQAKADAEEWSARLESFISSMADGVTLFDADGTVIMMNQAGRAIFGVPDGELYFDWSNYRRYTMDGKPIPVGETPSYRALRGEEIKDYRYRIITPWGRELIISVSASPVLDADGRIIGATNVFRDTTRQVEFEQRQEEVIARERHISEVLQKALIPEAKYEVPCCSVALRYEPALKEAEVGGDFYDVVDLGRNKLGILIGDVAGKGLQAAIRVAAARHAVRSYAYIDPRPGRVLHLTNDALCRDPVEDIAMVTAFFAILDTSIGVITYANAGHEAPVLCRADGSDKVLKVPGVALGVEEGHFYDEKSLILKPGDTLVMVTDGITEARPDSNRLFGLEGVAAQVSRMCNLPVEDVASGLIEAAKAHAGGRLRDDAAIIALRLKAGESNRR